MHWKIIFRSREGHLHFSIGYANRQDAVTAIRKIYSGNRESLTYKTPIAIVNTNSIQLY